MVRVVQPLRNRLQRGVNRLTYGQRDEPYAVIAQLGRRLEASAHTDTVLPAAVETLARALRLPYAAIRLGGDGVPAAAYGIPGRQPLALPLRHGADRQIGSAAHSVVLAADLQRSRERLVTAREEERRRLRRDLHDGLGPALAGLALTASTISTLIPDDPAEAGRTAEQLYHDIRSAIAEIRRLVYGLRPPPWTSSAWSPPSGTQRPARTRTRPSRSQSTRIRWARCLPRSRWPRTGSLPRP
jgi:signal transduction histidine kinase